MLDVYADHANVESFKQDGEDFFKFALELGRVKPTHIILDVGSGIGRKTLPLTRYLAPGGRYEGLDVNKVGTDWCTTRITKRFPNFQFQHIDLYSKHYNPGGKCKPSEYRFPFDDQTFDLVILESVFTHMLPDDVDHYLAEIARVMKPGGRSMITYFLLDEVSLPRIDAGRGDLLFRHQYGPCRIESAEVPETVIAYPTSLVLALYAKHGLEITVPIQCGSWSGRSDASHYQDRIVAEKSAVR